MTPFSDDPQLRAAWESLPSPFVVHIHGERGTAKSVVASVLCRGFLDEQRRLSVILVGSTMREFLCRAAGVGVLFYADLLSRRMTVDTLDRGSSLDDVRSHLRAANVDASSVVLLDDVSRLNLDRCSPAEAATDLLKNMDVGGIIAVGGDAGAASAAVPDLELVLTREGRPVELSRADARMQVATRSSAAEIVRFLRVGAEGFDIWTD